MAVPRPKLKTLPGKPGLKPKVTTLPGTKKTKPRLKNYGDDLIGGIDDYLAGRGSPMAGLGASFVTAGRRYGVDPRLLVGIGVIESSAGKYMKHPNNFANWGVHRGQQYGSYEEAINDLARGLAKNYIGQGLKSPGQIVEKYAPSSDGNDTGNWARVVGEVVQALGGNPGRGGRRPQSRGSLTTGRRPQSASAPPTSPFQLPRYKYSGGIDANKLAQAILSGMGIQEALTESTTPFRVEEIPHPSTQAIPAPASGVVKPKAPTPGGAKGGFLQAPSEFKGTHITDGLDLNKGKRTAADIMAAPGTQVGAPEAGTIIRHGSAQGGQALYFQSDSGHLYWLGHIEGMLPVGSRVERGQPIAVISADHAAPHLHIDRR